MTDAVNPDIENIDWLRKAEARLDATRRYNPESSEIGRLTSVCDEIAARCSPAALDAYRNPTVKVKSAKEKAADSAAELAAMEANRDRPSI